MNTFHSNKILLPLTKTTFKNKSLEEEYQTLFLNLSRRNFLIFSFLGVFLKTISLVLVSKYLIIPNFYLIIALAFILLMIVFLCLGFFFQNIFAFQVMKSLIFLYELISFNIIMLITINNNADMIMKIRIITFLNLFTSSAQFFLIDFSFLIKIFTFFNILILQISLIYFNGVNFVFELLFFLFNYSVFFLIEYEFNRLRRFRYLDFKKHDSSKQYSDSLFEGMPFMMMICKEKDKILINSKLIQFRDSLSNTQVNEVNKKRHEFKILIKHESPRINVEDRTQIIKNNFIQPRIETEVASSMLNNNNNRTSLELLPQKKNEDINIYRGDSQLEDIETMRPIISNLVIYELKDLSLKSSIFEFQEANNGMKVSLENLIDIIKNNKNIVQTVDYISIGYFKFQRKMESKQTHVFPKTSFTKYEVYQYFEIYYRKILNGKDVVVEILMNDITSLKELEKENAENKYKHKILSKVSHEFKTPLIAIITLCKDLLKSREKEKYEINLGQIKHLSYYIIFLVNDIVEYVNNQANTELDLETISPNKIVKFAFEILQMLCKFQDKSRIKPKLSLDEQLDNMIFRSDSNRILQILMNLISNSLKFTKNGFIKISTKKISMNSVSIQVEDSGSGISKEKLQKFNEVEKNQDLKVEYEEGNMIGSGLGIPICRKIAKKLNSKLNVNSEEGKGSIFSFEITNLTNDKNENNCLEQESSIKGAFNKNKIKLMNSKINIDIFDSSDDSEFSFEDRKNSKYSTIRLGNSIFKQEKSCIENELMYENNNNSNINTTLLINKDIFINESMRREMMKSPDVRSRKTSFLVMKKNNFNISYINNSDCINHKDHDLIPSAKYSSKLLNINESQNTKKSTNIKDNDIGSEHRNFKLSVIEEKNISFSTNNDKKSIVLVDDNKLCRDNLEQTILKCVDKYKDQIVIIHANDGVELLSLIIQQHPIICIFIDENMEYMNGSEAVSIIRKWESMKNMRFNFKIISVSAVTETSHKDRIKNSGIDLILPKPAKTSDITKVFEELIILDEMVKKPIIKP